MSLLGSSTDELCDDSIHTIMNLSNLTKIYFQAYVSRMNNDFLYEELGQAIKNAKSIPPCMGSDPDAWFPALNQGRTKELVNVRKLCMSCPVQKECLTYAVANPDLQGIWGGSSPRERRLIRLRQKA